MCNYLENKPEMSTPARVWTLGVVLLEAGDLQQFTVRAVFLHLIYSCICANSDGKCILRGYASQLRPKDLLREISLAE